MIVRIRTSPELLYIETKWASLMSYKSTADCLHDVLPVNQSLNPATVRNHLHHVAKRQEAELSVNPIICRVDREIGGNYRSPVNR